MSGAELKPHAGASTPGSADLCPLVEGCRYATVHAASGTAAPSWLRNRSVEYALPVSATMRAPSERDSNVRRFVSFVSSTEYERVARSQTASWSPILSPFDRDLYLNA